LRLRVLRALALLAPMLAGASGLGAQVAAPASEPPAQPAVSSLYWHGYRYGSEALFSPLTVLADKGFDIFQVFEEPDRDPRAVPWRARAAVLSGVFLHPAAAIERYPGWGPWLKTEVLPLSFGDDARWVPNYTEHLLGGGLTYRALTDWYRAHGAPVPALLAGTTTMAAAAVNEMLEYDERTPVPSSSVADLWIFDLGGVLLFSWDGPARWAQSTLHLTRWPTMASVVLPTGVIQNNGDYYVLKLPLPLEREQLLVRFGLAGQVGVVRKLGTERALSLALGLDTQQHRVDPATGQEYIDMKLGGGIYYDRNNSLLASASFSTAAQNRLSVNLYPGLIDRGPLKDVGLWLVAPAHQPVRIGVASRWLLGMGLGWAP
jgi:hypothetical protein